MASPKYDRLSLHHEQDMEKGTDGPTLPALFNMYGTAGGWTSSHLSFDWVAPLIRAGGRSIGILKSEELFELPEDYRARQLYGRFKTKWRRHAGSPSRLLSSLHSLIWCEFWQAGVYRFLNDMSVLASPALIRHIVQASDDGNVGLVVGWATVIMINGLLASVALQQFIHGSFMTGSQVVSATNSVCFHAVLRLKLHKCNPPRSLGEINNIQAKDCNSLREFVVFAHNLWACPMVLIICMAMLVSMLGAAGLVACVLLPCLLPIESRISKWSRELNRQALARADARLATMFEVVDGIKTIKFASSGPHVERKAQTLRREELSKLWDSLMVQMANTVLTSASTLLVTLCTFGVYALTSDAHITADKAFSSLVVIGIIGRPLKVLPKCVSLLADARVSCQRIEGLVAAAGGLGEGEEEEEEEEEQILNKLPGAGAEAKAEAKAEGEGEGSDESDESQHGSIQLSPLWRVGAGSSAPNPSLSSPLDQEQGRDHDQGQGQDQGRGKGGESAWSARVIDGVARLSLQNVSATRPPTHARVLTDVSLALALPLQPPQQRGANKSSDTINNDTINNNNSSINNNLVVVTGDVGSGKTSLLLALLDEIDLDSGSAGDGPLYDKDEDKDKGGAWRVYEASTLPHCQSQSQQQEMWPRTRGRTKGRGRGEDRCEVAYVPHDPWILNATVRQNLIMASPRPRPRQPRDSGDRGRDRGREGEGEREGVRGWGLNEAIEACCLGPDIASWADGLDTVIGERGVNLSGGQRQRIALARALMSSAPVLLLDAVLSGSDVVVAAQVFSRAIVAASKERLCILTTHQAELHAQQASVVLVMAKGRVAFNGAFEEFRGFSHHSGSGRDSASAAAAAAPSALPRATLGLVARRDQEDKGKGEKKAKSKEKEKDSRDLSSTTDSLRTLKKYLHAAHSENVVAAIVLTTLAFGFGAFGDFLLSQWTDGRCTAGEYLGRYAAVSVVVTALTAARYWSYAKSGLAASTTLHRQLLASVLGAPVSFFDATPSGRIASRFSSDMNAIDVQIPSSLSSLVDSFFGLLTGIAVVMLGSWLYIFFVIPLAVLYYRISRAYRAVSKQLKVLDSAAKSPIASHFRETAAGLEVLRAFGPPMLSTALNRHYCLVDEGIRARLNWDAANRWLSVRLDIVGSLVVSAAAYALLLLHLGDATVAPASSSGAGHGGAVVSKGGAAGLMLRYALQATQSLTFAVRASTALENLLTSCDRVCDYIATPQEEQEGMEGIEGAGEKEPATGVSFSSFSSSSSHGLIADHDHDLDFDDEAVQVVHFSSSSSSSLSAAAAAADEKEHGGTPPCISVRGLNASYFPLGTNPPVLSNISLLLCPSAFIGLCGRTGGGKSSLALALMRAIPSTGVILLRGQDARTLPLRVYRQQLQLFPQDTFLFSGSLREYLDPSRSRSDQQVNELLREILRVTASTPAAADVAADAASGAVEGQRQGQGQQGQQEQAGGALLSVDSIISSGGSNLSAGERQCVVFARACLSSASALILDEITAQMDSACSRICLGIVRRELCGRGKAVLFISHRVEDLSLCDEVMLMRSGSVVMRASPEEATRALADQEEP